MKIVHGVGWYLPDSVGGSEVYVQNLCRELSVAGFESVVCAPAVGGEPSHYEVDGVPVYRYPVSTGNDSVPHSVLDPHPKFDQFKQWLASENAEVFHAHSFTYGCNVPHIEAAAALGLKTVVTLHTSSGICARDTMMYMGKSACDGRIDMNRCSQCWLESRGVSPVVRAVLAKFPWRVANAIGAVGQGRAVSAVSARLRVRQQNEGLSRLSAASNRIVAVCQWLYDALLANGVDPEKLLLSRQGIAEGEPDDGVQKRADVELRVGYMGRLVPIKGIEVLIHAVKALPTETPLRLLIYGVTNSAAEVRYRTDLVGLAGDDARIEFCDPVRPTQVLSTIASFDVLAVPSNWLETGPLVVLEAQSVGVPVLGSDLGGIKELVHGTDTGWLLPPHDVSKWRDKLLELSNSRHNIGLSPRSVRTMTEVGEEMAQLYRAF